MSDTPQSAANHTRWDPPFHFFLMPFLLLSVIALVYRLYLNPEPKHLWLLVAGFAAIVLALKARLYALKAQDRVIRLEEKLRLASLMSDAPARASGGRWDWGDWVRGWCCRA